MAGQFFLFDIKRKALNHILANYANATLGPLQHGNVGWNANSRVVINAVKNNNPPAQRAGLPPHRYLELPSQPNMEQLKYWWSNEAALWIHTLKRPLNISKGLNGYGGAGNLWNQGFLREALIAELRACPVSIEIYYIGGVEIN